MVEKSVEKGARAGGIARIHFQQEDYQLAIDEYRALAKDFRNIDPRATRLLQIAHELEARRPRFRYPVGPLARLNHFLRGKLPSRLLRRATTPYLGLSRARQ